MLLLLSARLHSEWVWLASREREKEKDTVVVRPLRWIFIGFLFFLWRWHTTTFIFKVPCLFFFFACDHATHSKKQKKKKLDRINSCLTFIFSCHVQIIIQNCSNYFVVVVVFPLYEMFEEFFEKFNLISISRVVYVLCYYLHKKFRRQVYDVENWVDAFTLR